MSKTHADRFVTLVDDAKTRSDEITPKKVKAKMDSDEDVVLLDVREQDEWHDAHIAGANYMAKA